MRNHSMIALMLIANGLLPTPINGDDWPQWRGAAHDSHVEESTGFISGEWPLGDAAWSVNVNAGGSAPIAVGDRVYAMGWNAGKDYVTCIDANTGREIWKQSYACPEYGRHSDGDKGLYSGPSSCPSYDIATGLLYTISCDGDLNCWDSADNGKRIWGINFYNDYQVAQRPKVGRRLLRDYGYTTAPLLIGDAVIAEVGDDEGCLMAFSKKTGERLWTSESKDPAGHTGGIVPITVEGLPCVAVLTIRNLLIARLDKGHEGETLAEYPWVTDFANSIATPAVRDNSVVITSEYNQYAITRIDISRSGVKQIWSQPYASGVCSPVISGNHVYWCWRGLYCLNFETGKPMWRGGRFNDTASCIATSDDRLIVWAGKGDLVLVETATRSPDKYTEVARKPTLFKADVWPHIVLSRRRLICKDRDGNMKCFVLPKS